jgi:hypothetical protein
MESSGITFFVYTFEGDRAFIVDFDVFRDEKEIVLQRVHFGRRVDDELRSVVKDNSSLGIVSYLLLEERHGFDVFFFVSHQKLVV